MERTEPPPQEVERKEVFVVRIYRRGLGLSGPLVGIVEPVQSWRRIPFRTGEELLSVLRGEDGR